MIRALRAQVYTGFGLMKVSTLKALSPADGRYADKVNGLRDIFSEYGLIRFRVLVEVRWLQALADEKDIPEIGPLSPVLKDLLNSIVDDFSLDDAERVKKIEATTNHDVKAVEYFIREKLGDGPDTAPLKDFLHFGCTSEDINNVAYALMLRTARSEVLIPLMRELKAKLQSIAHQHADVAMLSRTHGQPASPTTLGKELANFVKRLELAQRQLGGVTIRAKFNGAVGNFNAHAVAYPDADWPRYHRALHRGTGPGVELAHDADRAARLDGRIRARRWLATTRSSSTCAGTSGATFRSATSSKRSPATKSDRPRCRTRSTRSISRTPRATSAWPTPCSVILPRNCPCRAGSAISPTPPCSATSALRSAYAVIAMRSALKGIDKLQVNREAIRADIEDAWELLAEAVQTVMRRYGIPEPYEKLKALTRGQAVTRELIQGFIETLDIPAAEKARLLELTPESYLGLAEELARDC